MARPLGRFTLGTAKVVHRFLSGSYSVRFAMFHHEDVPSAKERYKNEAKRVTKVLNDFLADKEYLVGNKCTYADLSFVTWASMFPLFFGGQLDIKGEFPHYNAWMERLMARPAVKKVMDEKKAANSQ